MSSVNSNYSNYGSVQNTSSSSTQKNTNNGSEIFALSSQLSSIGLYGNGYGANTSLSSSQLQGATNFKSATDKLVSAVAAVMGRGGDGATAFGGFEASSSDKDSLTATYNKVEKYSSEWLAAKKDPSYKPSTPTDKGVLVEQLATKQENKSNSLQNGEKALDAGGYRFEIEVGGKSKEISFSVSETDTNEDINKKLATAINKSGSGVTAKLMTDDVKGATYLKIESNETGIDKDAEKAFSIKDVIGNASEKLGLDNTTKNAQNAKIRVGEIDTRFSDDDYTEIMGEGTVIESKSNSVKIDDRTTINAKKVTGDYVAVTYKNDTKEGINKVRDLVNGFNSLMDNAQNYADDNRNSARLVAQLEGLVGTYGDALSEVGITRNENGFLQIDDEKMQQASNDGKLAKLFDSEEANANYGFANKLKTIANQVGNNPANYVTEKKSQSELSSDSLSSNGDTGFSKLYFQMQKYDNMGSLFNSMF